MLWPGTFMFLAAIHKSLWSTQSKPCNKVAANNIDFEVALYPDSDYLLLFRVLDSNTHLYAQFQNDLVG